jgi:hypothetical protein
VQYHERVCAEDTAVWRISTRELGGCRLVVCEQLLQLPSAVLLPLSRVGSMHGQLGVL